MGKKDLIHDAILVIGGAGYVGSHFCKRAVMAGYRPITYDNLSRGNSSSVKWGPLEIGDIRDTVRLIDVVRQYRPIAVVHFAALAYVGESVADPISYYDTNVRGSVALVQAIQAEGVKRIVFSSTCATYGIPSHLPITEDTPQRPINPYGRTKLIVESFLSDVAAANGISVVALRYFNAAGADAEFEIGEHHDPETHLIPLALSAASRSGPSLKVFGKDYPTADGTCIRDFIHVDDLAEAHLRALDFMKAQGGFHAFNLGTGAGFSVMQIVEMVERVTGRTVPLEFEARRPGDPPVLIADPSLARSKLRWQATKSDLTNIVKTAWGWMKQSSRSE